MSTSKDETLFQHFDRLEVVDSTNEYLKAFLGKGEPRMVMAHEQTAGRGRFHRNWFSPPGLGLYLSYLLYPGWDVGDSPLVNMITGLAVVRAIHEVGPPGSRLRIKLPNDVLLGGRKVAGILTEMGSLDDRVMWAIVGIGVNLNHTEFPAEIGEKATSLRLEGITVGESLEFCMTLTRHFEVLFRKAGQGHAESLRKSFEAVLEGSEANS